MRPQTLLWPFFPFPHFSNELRFLLELGRAAGSGSLCISVLQTTLMREIKAPTAWVRKGDIAARAEYCLDKVFTHLCLPSFLPSFHPPFLSSSLSLFLPSSNVDCAKPRDVPIIKRDIGPALWAEGEDGCRTTHGQLMGIRDSRLWR